MTWTSEKPTVAVELLDWLRVKLSDAEAALKAREEMARTWRHGSDEAWEAAAAMHPKTAGKALKRAARLTEAKKHARIATWCRRDVAMFRATLAALEATGQFAGPIPKPEEGK
jgi:hypothetical protein